MNRRNRFGRMTIALMIFGSLLVGGCASAAPAAPASQETQAPATEPAQTQAQPIAEDGSVTVHTVDEFLAAIAPDTTIIMEDGTYDLSQASGYSDAVPGEYYDWEDTWVDGFQLTIHNVTNLSIRAKEGAEVTIAAMPRYANVLVFDNSSSISIDGLTVGHTEEQGTCGGGVLYFHQAKDISITDCKLYGCGTLGVDAYDSSDITVVGTDIYDCSQGGVLLNRCSNVSFDRCRFYNCVGWNAIFDYTSSRNIAVTNSQVFDNETPRLVSSLSCGGIYFGGVEFQGNNVIAGMFTANQESIVLDGCSFTDNNASSLTAPSEFNEAASFQQKEPMTPEGTVLSMDDLMTMELKSDVQWDEDAYTEPTLDVPELTKDEMGMIHVSNVDELLAAIGSDTTIFMENGTYDLSTAQNYGHTPQENYFWADQFDGPALVITGVKNLTIIGNGADKVTVSAVPRYADVLTFQDCSGIVLNGFTAGHTIEPGSCIGGVLNFRNVSDVLVDACSLFGCGVLGITTESVDSMKVINTEIHHCEYGAVRFSNTSNVAMTNCNIHDNGEQTFDLWNCEGITVNGKTLPDGVTVSVK